MNRVRRSLIGVLVVLVIAVTSGCYSIAQTPSDPGYPLKHDWSPGIPIETGITNSCYFTRTNVNGRQNLCRIVEGYEENGDNRNWDVHFTPDANGGTADDAPLARAGESTSTYGIEIVTPSGEIYEGCRMYHTDDNGVQGTVYWCDYHIRKPVVFETGKADWTWYLAKFWNWTGLVADELGCAGGFVGLWYGNPITLPFLRNCLDSPRQF